jgi:hypothetical protein
VDASSNWRRAAGGAQVEGEDVDDDAEAVGWVICARMAIAF